MSEEGRITSISLEGLDIIAFVILGSSCLRVEAGAETKSKIRLDRNDQIDDFNDSG